MKLKENRTIFVPTLNIKLTFDDETSKDFILSLGDKAEITMLKDGEVHTISGKILSINPYLGFIELDCSKEFESNVESILIKHILDATKIEEDNTETPDDNKDVNQEPSENQGKPSTGEDSQTPDKVNGVESNTDTKGEESKDDSSTSEKENNSKSDNNQ